METIKLLELELPLISLKVDQRLISDINRWYEKWKKQSDIKYYKNDFNDKVFLDFLLFKTDELISELNNTLLLYTQFRKKYSKASDDIEKEDVILTYGVKLAPFEHKLYDDQDALKRWMGDDAVNERFDNVITDIKRKLIFIIKRIGVIFKYNCKNLDKHFSVFFWNSVNMVKYLNPLITIQTDSNILCSVLDCLSDGLSCIDESKNDEILLSKQHERFIYRLCLEVHQDVWVQSSALKVLFYLTRDSFISAAKKRLENNYGEDDIFVRNRILQIISQSKQTDKQLYDLVKISNKDSSEFVRQGFYKAIVHFKDEDVLDLITKSLIKETKDSVCSYGLECLNNTDISIERYSQFINDFIKNDRSDYIIRFVMDCIYTFIKQHKDINEFKVIIEIIENIVQSHKKENIRRYAGEYLLLINVHFLISSNKNLKNLYMDLKKLQSSRTLRVSKELVDTKGFDLVLSSLTIESHPLELEKTIFGYKIFKGERRNSKFWRFVYETKYTSPDKREAYDHTQAREYKGLKIYPSNKLAEVTPTKVPGEPLVQSYEGGWLNYLPLASHINHALKSSIFSAKPVILYTSQGETYIKVKGNIFKKIYVYFWSLFNFNKIANQRKDTVQKNVESKSFKSFLNTKGIDIDFKAYGKKDTSIMQFFSVAILLDPVEYYILFEDYFVSAYENTLLELMIFTLAMTFLFLYRHRVKYKKLIKARKQIPLVIGGWGTRGKSGTERIKAAMFNSLGYNIVSKTTGCEAMFLHSRGYSSLKEMFLFRPYDKASIWEQHDLVMLSSKMDTDIFLWECMALTPSYVNILQQEWMNDDISTITNTYPDHENLQGPSGRDIPEVMKNFIPKNSVLLTSEEEMTPLLEEDTLYKNSTFKSVGWKESGKIADDILKRFPYDEHPYNIALVNELGKYLQIDEDLALKSMSDLVIPDIGVLKTFPIAHFNNRKLEFINGMSANERFGTLSNWERIGLYDYTLEKNPEVFISTVINNRADRISRSRVFADIVTFDLNADIHFLIGTNLNGFLVYIKESFFTYKDKLSLFKNNEPLIELDRLSDIYRLPKSEQIVQKRIDIINQGDYEKPDMEKFISNIKNDLEFYNQIKTMIEEKKEPKFIQKEFETKLLERIISRIIVISNPNMSGDEIIKLISEHTPYNMLNKIMGLQNIKGTGLDFVYRFLNWEQCYNSCQKILSKKRVVSLEGITQLSRFREFGPLSFNYVSEILNNISKTPIAQTEYYQVQIDNILNYLEELKKESNHANLSDKDSNKILTLIKQSIESFLDAGDAIKRKKDVEKIYTDLINYRISHEKAAIELKKINKRQKGGWINQIGFNFSIFKR